MAPTASPSPSLICASHFRVAFVADVAGMRSAVEAAGWQGVQSAERHLSCLQAEFITSRHPSDYRENLQAAVDRHSDLIIAGSFLLADDTVDAALANPQAHFVLINPLVPTSSPSNLAIITFREDDAGYLAGALAGRITKTGIVAGVYGLEDDHDTAYRLGFERGAHAISASIRVLGVYQGAQDGSPYNNPGWGATQAHAFIDQGADVIFGSGDLTGHGALTAASQAGASCITIGYSAEPSPPVCLVAMVVLHVDRATAAITVDAAAARWQGGERRYGLSDGYIELRSAN